MIFNSFFLSNSFFFRRFFPKKIFVKPSFQLTLRHDKLLSLSLSFLHDPFPCPFLHFPGPFPPLSVLIPSPGGALGRRVPAGGNASPHLSEGSLRGNPRQALSGHLPFSRNMALLDRNFPSVGFLCAFLRPI